MKNYLAHGALIAANIIYGINYSVAKDVMPDYVQPFGFILLRVIGALMLFWTVHSFFFKEKIARQDILKLLTCGFFGVALNQLLFFKGLNITTPINASIIMTSTPILVLLISHLILKEKITWTKVSGILIGLTGALLLIFFKSSGNGFQLGFSNIWGDVMILVNAISYGCYLVLVKPLMAKYHPLTVIKWVFSFGFLFVLPVSFSEFREINWDQLPATIVLEIIFVVVFTTFFAYVLNIFGLKKLSPSVVSTYLYLQPIITAIIAIAFDTDHLDTIKVVATLFIFASIYLVSKPVNGVSLNDSK